MRTLLLVIGKLLSAVLALLSAAFLFGLAQLQMLPTEYLVAAGVILAVLTGLVLWLTWAGLGKVKMTAGFLLSFFMVALLSVGIVFVNKTLDTLDRISASDTEIVRVGIYVRAEDDRDYSALASSCCHGILQDLDRESIDKVLQIMTETLGTVPKCQEYQRLPELVDALLDGQVGAIILNAAYLDLLQEMVGYEDILNRIRETELKKVEVEIDQPVDVTPTMPDKGEDAASVPGPFLLYITGIDNRGAMIARSRSDVNILAVVNPAIRQVLLINTPRDYYVPLSVSKGKPDKLTHAGIYGVRVCIDTMQMLYGVDVDYCFRVNFGGFMRVIDALGSITVYSNCAFRTGDYSFQIGENMLNGKSALAFCRERHAFKDGDHQRGRNQMAVIRAVIQKLMSPSMLQNFSAVLSSVEGCFEMDIPLDVIGALVSDQLRNGGEWNIVTYSVSGKGDMQIPYSLGKKVYVMQPDYKTVDRAKELIEMVYNGEIIEP